MRWRTFGRRWAHTVGLAACLLLPGLGPGVAAQETLLGRWTLGYLSESWSPRWSGPASAHWPDAEEVPRVRVTLSAEHLSFREALGRDQATADLGFRVPVGGAVALRASATSGAWSTESGGRPLLETPRSHAVAAGADVAVSVPLLGRLRAEALGGWDRGPGGFARAGTSSSHHEFTVAGWRAHARASRVVLPADSLRDLGTSHVTTGVELAGTVAVPVVGLTLRPSARWKRESFEAPEEGADGFLTAGPGGSHTWLDAGMQVHAGAWRLGGRYRRGEASLDSRIMRLGESAGQLPVAILDLQAWSATASLTSGERRWTVEGGSDEVTGELSARVETWPFAGFWGSLSAQAYRLNGDMTAQSRWLRVRNTLEEGSGWSWSAEVGHYSLRVDRDSWYVTSFGFGRRDREITASGVDSAVLVGGGVTRRLVGDFGATVLRVQAGVPVHARALEGAPEPSGEGVAGYLRVTLDWAW